MSIPRNITLDHGSGGLKTDQLVDWIANHLQLRNSPQGIGIDARDDSAVIKIAPNLNLCTTIDGHTVDPLFFPGGDIGKLAMCGTINDIAVMGAIPLGITISLLIEEGLETEILEKAIQSMNIVSISENVPIIGGDTKVMPKGAIDRLVIVSSAVGTVSDDRLILDSQLKEGDAILLTGAIGTHGIALLSVREGLQFSTTLQSDVASLLKPIQAILQVVTPHGMKDPTRGGLASALNDMAEQSKVQIEVDETAVPVLDAVNAAAEMLGLDVYAIANEGAAVMGIPPSYASQVLHVLQKFDQTKNAAIIGRVTSNSSKGEVFLKTTSGGMRALRKPLGKIVPRIC